MPCIKQMKLSFFLILLRAYFYLELIFIIMNGFFDLSNLLFYKYCNSSIAFLPFIC